jgi:hypothetical protein
MSAPGRSRHFWRVERSETRSDALKFDVMGFAATLFDHLVGPQQQ